ncbi:MAG TPA: phytoene/squalene synthase family protein [Aliidongia sp.]|nr:phytoene/squalene synthase family protein [Aliidongia sp.]
MTDLVETVRRYDRDRFLATLFAPASLRPDLWALLAFNLEIARVREVVSQPILGQIRLQWWRDAIGEIYDGKPARRHEVATPLAETIKRHGLSRHRFDALIDARERDLLETPPATLAELEAYVAASAGELFALQIECLAPGEAESPAIGAIGIGWGLAGLVRAVPFHAATSRIFIPTEIAEPVGLDEAAIRSGRFTPALGEALANLAEIARAHLAAGRAVRPRIGRAALPALLPALLADRQLVRLAAVGYDPYVAEVQRPDPLAAWRMARGWLTRRF